MDLNIYLINQNGKYNVPYREYKNTKIYDESNILMKMMYPSIVNLLMK